MYTFEEIEEDYDEDLILLNYEQNSIYHRKAEGFNNLNGAWRFSEDIILNPSFQRLCTSPISNRTAPKNNRSLSVKLIDCRKFPWYFKRYTQQIIDNLKYLGPIVITDSDTDDDCIILGGAAGNVSITTKSDCPGDNVVEVCPNMQSEKKRLAMKRLQSMKRREDKELQQALNQKNKDDIDFKRNKGLIGLTITRKIILNDVAPKSTIDQPQKDTENMEQNHSGTTYLNVADKMLSSCGTDLIERTQDLETSSTMKDKKANLIANNVESGSDKQKAIRLSDSSLNMSVKCPIDKDKRRLKDNSKKKMDISREKAEKQVGESKKPMKPASVIQKDSISKLNTKHSRKNVKDSKKTNKYINEQIKKHNIDITTQSFNRQQKHTSMQQTTSNENVEKAVSKDLNDIPETKKDYKKLTNVTEKRAKGIESGPSSPILPCNSILKKHKSAHEITLKRTSSNITQNALMKIRTDKESSKCEILNNISNNIIKHNILKPDQNEDKRRTGPNESVTSPNQNTVRNKLHYYSLSYRENENKNSVDTQKSDKGKIKKYETNQTNSVKQNLPASPLPLVNNQKKNTISILSVERINNNTSVPKKSQLPCVDDKINRLPEDLPQYQTGPLNASSQNNTNHKHQNVMRSIPNKSSKRTESYLFHSFNNGQVHNYKPAVIFKSKCQNNPQQHIHTHVSSRPMLPHYRGVLPNRGAPPNTGTTLCTEDTMYRNSFPPNGLYSNSSVCHHTTFRSPLQPVIPSVTIQSSQDMYPRVINPNRNPRNYTVPKDHKLRVGNNRNIPSGHGNSSVPSLLSLQPFSSSPLSFQRSQHSSQQTPFKSNPSRCPLICDNNITKNNPLAAPELQHFDEGHQAQMQSVPDSRYNSYFKTPVSIMLETLEPVESKMKMLEELDKVTIEEDFDIHLRVKTDEKKVATNSKSETCPSLPFKGYSPPILPIPVTLEEIMEKVKSEPRDNSEKDVNLNTSTEMAKKISLREYKKRTNMNDDTDCSPNKKMCSVKHGDRSSAKNHRNQSIDSDLGYDSDAITINVAYL